MYFNILTTGAALLSQCDNNYPRVGLFLFWELVFHCFISLGLGRGATDDLASLLHLTMEALKKILLELLKPG